MAGKSLYQSDLVKAPYTLTMTSEVKRSERGPFVYVKLDNGEERVLNIENESIAQLLGGYPQNQLLTLKGYGTREKATIQVVEHTSARQVAMDKHAPVERDERNPIVVDMAACWEAAGELTNDEAVRGTLCNTMFIELNKSGGKRPLYHRETPATRAIYRPADYDDAPAENPEPAFLDTPAGFKNHPGKTWRQLAVENPDGVEWAIKNMRKLSDVDREELRVALRPKVKNPFLEEEVELPL